MDRYCPGNSRSTKALLYERGREAHPVLYITQGLDVHATHTAIQCIDQKGVLDNCHKVPTQADRLINWARSRLWGPDVMEQDVSR